MKGNRKDTTKRNRIATNRIVFIDEVAAIASPLRRCG